MSGFMLMIAWLQTGIMRNTVDQNHGSPKSTKISPSSSLAVRLNLFTWLDIRSAFLLQMGPISSLKSRRRGGRPCRIPRGSSERFRVKTTSAARFSWLLRLKYGCWNDARPPPGTGRGCRPEVERRLRWEMKGRAPRVPVQRGQQPAPSLMSLIVASSAAATGPVNQALGGCTMLSAHWSRVQAAA